MLIHPRSLHDRTFDIWRSPGRFTKNPDLIELPGGRLMLVYSDNDQHWSQEDQILTLLVSDDGGRTWREHRRVAHTDLRRGDERMVTPRLSRLRDGRLVILIDLDDFGHFHERQPSGILAYWSDDQGETWRGPQVTGIPGYEPDRVVELPDGTLGVVTQYLRDDQAHGCFLFTSADGGATWEKRGDVACDGYYLFCEGALVLLRDGSLACVMREDHSAGLPSLVTFSNDGGHTWSPAEMLPFSFHRPYAKQLRDGRVLVTGRNVNGGLGTYAWCGDLRAEAGYRLGGPRRKYAARLEADALVVDHLPEHECRYCLLPPETSRSGIEFAAELKVEGPADQPLAFLSISKINVDAGGRAPGIVLYVYRDRLELGTRGGLDQSHRVAMTDYHHLALRHDRGILELLVDGTAVMRTIVFNETHAVTDSYTRDPAKRTMFGQYGATGRSYWRRVSYRLRNPTVHSWEWQWRAADGTWPNQYERERLIQLHGNHPDQQPNPDNGYSSWIERAGGSIFFVDYTNHGDPPRKAHLVATEITLADL